MDQVADTSGDGEIAEALFDSPTTAPAHFSAVKGRLRAKSRVGIATAGSGAA